MSKPKTYVQLSGGSHPRGPGRRTASFILSVLLQMGLPLLPLLVEKLKTGEIADTSWNVASGMWIVGLAVASDSPIVLWPSLLLGFVLIATLGVVAGSGTSKYPWLVPYSLLAASFVFVLERVYKHLFLGEPCPGVEKE